MFKVLYLNQCINVKFACNSEGERTSGAAPLVKRYRISSSKSTAGRFFPVVQDAEHSIYILQEGTRRRAVCVGNGERAAERILDLDEELEM